MVRGESGQKLARPYLNKQAGCMELICNPSHEKAVGRKIVV
jgi:hypothetical protein